MDPRIQLLRDQIRDVPDFPKPGIVFKDITPLLAEPDAFRATLDLLAERIRSLETEAIVAVESRGFLFGGALALSLKVPLHIVRKPGKLPWKTDAVEYELEYGTDTLEIHQESLGVGQRVVVLDDLLATGGTAAATAQLCAKQGAEVVACGFVVELAFLNGRQRIPVPCFSLVSF